MPYKDPDKRRAYKKEWTRRNPRSCTTYPYYKLNIKTVFEAKNKPCKACGGTFPAVAMDLHHINPDEKEFTINAGQNRVSHARLVKELEKCIPLCAICHRLLHAGLIELVI